ncbi:hypothetical protein J6590_003945 [Homalodisca vitripennis]|nr:hypothetical protein J6590_003945 [Homalodisca vitripennis]
MTQSRPKTNSHPWPPYLKSMRLIFQKQQVGRNREEKEGEKPRKKTKLQTILQERQAKAVEHHQEEQPTMSLPSRTRQRLADKAERSISAPTVDRSSDKPTLATVEMSKNIDIKVIEECVHMVLLKDDVFGKLVDKLAEHIKISV